jgi:cytochrome c biogenesis protein CcdA
MSSFLWLAAVTGALSLLTPCVFPMIPVTATYFSQLSHRGRGWVLRNALLFAGGIVNTIMEIGLGAKSEARRFLPLTDPLTRNTRTSMPD